MSQTTKKTKAKPREGPGMVRGHVLSHRASVEMDTPKESLTRDWVVPLGAIVVGLAARTVHVAMADRGDLSLAAALLAMVVGLVLTTACLCASVLGVVWLMGAELEQPGVVARKVVGAAVLTAAIAGLLAALEKDPMAIRGLVLAAHAVLLIHFVLVAYLLRLDLTEALMAAVLATGATMAALLVLGRLLAPETVRLVFF